MRRDTIALQADYGDHELANLVDMPERAGHVLRRHARATRAERRG